MPEKVTMPSLLKIEQPGGADSDEVQRARVAVRIVLVGAVLGLLSIALYVLIYVQTGAWQVLADAGLVALAILCLVPARSLTQQGKLDSAGYWILLAISLAYGGGTLVWANTAIYNAVGGVLLIFLVGSMIRPRNWRLWLIVVALYLAVVVLVDWMNLLPRYDITQSSMLRVHVPLVTGALVLLTLWQVVRAFSAGAIRTRLLVAFVVMALVPAVVVSASSIIGGLASGQSRAQAHLESVAVLKEAEINSWVQDLQFDMLFALTGDEVMRHAIELLQRPDPSEYQTGYSVLQTRFQQVIQQSGRFEELFLLDLQGKVVLSTDATHEGEIRSNQGYFQEGLQGTLVQQPFYSLTDNRSIMMVSRPIADGQGQVLGVMAGRASLSKLDEIMAERTGLGDTGETYLVGGNHTLLTPTRLGDVNVWVSTEGINTAIDAQANGTGLYKNYRAEPVVGAYRWLPTLQVVLLAEQERKEALQGIYLTLGIMGGVALLSVLLAVGASLLVTRDIANPLSRLAEVATRIAGGDLARVAQVEREDEIGMVAQAFNAMTTRLRDLISGLEQRVADRTRDLARRSAYLEAAADVGQAASSILDRDELMLQAVELICERFGLYYVGLFLVDETGEWAELQANAGKTGRDLPATDLRLPVGDTSMIGWCIAHRQARVALEASEDEVRLAQPELPDTRSEAALPLRSRGQVLGAISLQHTEPGAFDQDTVVVLQTMADQVAVALDNARLFAQREEALEAANRAYGELSEQAWVEILQARTVLGYRSDERGIAEAGDVWRPQMEEAMRTGQTVRGNGGHAAEIHPLTVPIKIRGQVVGVLDTYKPVGAGDWTQDEIALLEAIASQLDSALESARLYQDTQHRAAREQVIRHVTEHMRRAVDIETILQNTVTELANALGAPRAYVRLGTDLNPGAGDGQGDKATGS